jgi:phage gp36-like protein
VTGSDSLFQLSLTEGGSAEAFGPDVGAGAFTITESLNTTVQLALNSAQGDIVEALINYRAPIADAPPPLVLVKVECWIAAYELAITQGLVVPSYWEQARQTHEALYRRAQDYLEQWRNGKPVQGLAADSTPDVLENGAVFIEDGAAPNWLPTCNGQQVIA